MDQACFFDLMYNSLRCMGQCYHGALNERKLIVYCVKSGLTIEETIKKSRFIGIITPCQSEAEAIEHLQKFHNLHPNASHVAFAYRIKTKKGIVSRFHDAGEPGGTSGRPIYQYLEGKDLINVIIAVIRYFGGIKLGAGGLTRAYGNSAKKAMEAAEIMEFVEYETIQLKLNYNQLQSFEYHLKKLDGKIIQQEFSEQVELVVSLPGKNVAALSYPM